MSFIVLLQYRCTRSTGVEREISFALKLGNNEYIGYQKDYMLTGKIKVDGFSDDNLNNYNHLTLLCTFVLLKIAHYDLFEIILGRISVTNLGSV